MSSFPYEREGGPKLLDSAGLREFMYALRLHDARWLTIPRFVAVASPLPGVDWTVTVPSGVTWIVCGIAATFVSSATAASRSVALTVSDGVTVGVRVGPAFLQTATLTVRYGWFRGGVQSQLPVTSLDTATGVPKAPLPGNSVISTATAALQAGDQWSAIGLYVLQVRERTMQELASYADDLLAGQHDELFPGFQMGL